MADQPWLKHDDQLLLDGVDYRVVAVLVVRADRTTFQHLTMVPQLGGERRALLQTEDAVMEVRDLPPERLSGEQIVLDTRSFELRWDSDARTERITSDAGTKFGRGRCAWYAADDDAVAVLIVERYQTTAFIGEPLESSRVDLRFTVGLRDGRE